ncbi:MAG: Stp1/IreP family PP2C-type Ser/Thr phosphatase [Actinomycetota bacterium]|nr:Stp1/IreP family PP2C-type Ser/Thr phosphatase [Actinomycetota bacterium]
MRHGARTDIGRVRRSNEDGYLAKGEIFAVADGMGGHLAGEIASASALSALSKYLKKLPGDANPQALLMEAVQRANEIVFQKALQGPEQVGMGTTLTVALFAKKEVYIGHIGDSRAYLLREGKLTRLTDDHTLVTKMVKEGKLEEEEAQLHPRRNVLTRALGTEPNVKADFLSIKIAAADKILLCTDGLTAMLDDGEIERLLGSDKHPQTICDELAKAANERGGVDNITAVLIEAGSARESELAEKRGVGKALRWGPAKKSLLALTLVALVGIASLLAFSSYLDRTYYLGFHKDRVALYRGLPGTIFRLKLGVLERETGITREDLPLYYQERLEKGIIAGDREKAERIIDDIPLLERGATMKGEGI